jgi:RimJ/RimL family protein N-acetyltransferase
MTASNITYRTARVSDAAAIVEFYNYVGGETHFLSFEKDEYPLDVDAQVSAIEALEGNATNIMLMAMDGDEIAGIATINSPSKIKSRHDGELGIVVAKKYQGQGIGTELISRLIEWAKGNGVTTRISLDTSSLNYDAIHLYMKFGFIMEGCRKNAQLIDGVYSDLYLMGMMIK